jgi:hypothetical protein
VRHPLIFNVPSFGILLFRYFVLGFVVNGTGKGGHLWIPLLVLPVPGVICKQRCREHQLCPGTGPGSNHHHMTE